MASDDTSGKRQGTPVVLRIKLKYDSIEAMVHRFAVNVGKSGIFLPTRSIHPPGTEIKFELRLATDAPALVGLGKVQSGHEPDAANPRTIFGMAIEIIRVTREGRQILVRMIERRRAMGLPEVAIPIPADLDAARRADVETQPRAQIPTAGRSLLPQHAPTVLTAPRTTSLARTSDAEAGDRNAALALAPEPPRRVRRRVSAVIAAARQNPSVASGQESASLLEGQVDLRTTVARARALASGDLDHELAALREGLAAPVAEITIEAASAELARHLGGAAVKRDRSAPVAAPTSNAVPQYVEAATTPEDAKIHNLDEHEQIHNLGNHEQIQNHSEHEPIQNHSEHEPAHANGEHELVLTNRADENAPASVFGESSVAAIAEARLTPAAESELAVEPATESPPAAESQMPESSLEPATENPRRTTRRTGRRRTRGSIAPPATSPRVTEDAVQADTAVAFEPAASATSEPVPVEPIAPESSASVAATNAGLASATPSEPVEPSSTAEPEPTPPSHEDQEDDPDLLSFERALDAARIQTGVTIKPAPPAPDDDADSSPEIQVTSVAEPEAEEEVDELDDAELQQLRIITPPSGVATSDIHEVFHQQAAHVARRTDSEEISEVDVLAEADADDDDLLHAHRNPELLPAMAPTYEASVNEAPPYNAPAYDAPAYGASSYDAPAYNAPSHDAPPYSGPGYDAPPLPDLPLPHADLRHADLRHSDLPHSDPPHPDLPHPDLHFPDLPPADLLHPDRLHPNLPSETSPRETPYYVSPAPEYLNPHRPAYETYDEARPSYVAAQVKSHEPDDFDFASRLDLDDDDADVEDAGASYTFADRLPASANARRPFSNFDDPYGIGHSVRSDEVYGLEDALSNLDADPDADDVPRAFASQRFRSPPSGPPHDRRSEPAIVYAPRPRRLATDSEGVVIDFDDDDDEFPE